MEAASVIERFAVQKLIDRLTPSASPAPIKPRYCKKLCSIYPTDIDYFLDFPGCTASSLLPGAGFNKSGLPDRLLYTQDIPTLKEVHRHIRIPVVWEATVQISSINCYLTTEGDSELFPDEPWPVASCWLEACPAGTPGATTPEDWKQLLRRLEGIMESPGERKVALGEYISWVRGENLGMLQVSWGLTDPRDGSSRGGYLPIYTKDINTQELRRISPRSLDEVPFHQPMRVLFICWKFPSDEDGRPFAMAQYYFMHAA